MATVPVDQKDYADSLLDNRWVILLFSIISMVAVANFQYGWTLFVDPLKKHLGVEAALIQVTFSIFVLLETWLVPFEGALVDKFGPKLLVMLGGLLAGSGWYGAGKAETLSALYISYAICGIGAGVVYGTAIGSALKWFPDHRGLAAGLTAAGFGAGSAATVAPLANMINPAGQPAGSGYQHTFIVWGIIQGAVVVIAALFLKAPPAGWLPKTWRLKGSPEVKRRQSLTDFGPGEMAATPHFWLMYAMMAMVATGGLMATAQLAPMAKDFKVDKIAVNLLFWATPALVFALQADRLLNGLCRPFWGWISDHIGRERTMTLAFGLEGVAKLGLLRFASNPMMFVVFSAFTFFGWGEIFSLFPALCGDFFGRRNATANYGFLYTAKGTASMFVPIGSALVLGKAFDFRADILLLLGGALVLFCVFLAPTVFQIKLGGSLKAGLLTAAGLLVAYGAIVTVNPGKIWTPFTANYAVPKIGWIGVFMITIVFDFMAAILAYFVLRRMKAPLREQVDVIPPPPAPEPQQVQRMAAGR
ncbi:MAG TPA: oxalate/formate MFS antiporter [Candidatus Sulfotelmatobacter sp.]|nr:oxalate/formate MFS antiporter [Candidatus Sulfotelmatobacter sp.]